MSILTHPAFGPRASLIYITVGVLMDVWTAVWYFAFARGHIAADGSSVVMTNTTWFWVVGLFLTGLTFVIIGLLLGHIGQAARRSEMPPSEAVNSEARIQQTAAANPAPIAVAGGVPVSTETVRSNPPIVVGS